MPHHTASTQYVALLRGINVGGKNLIKMADLKACLEAAGFANVTTYIQSGNILFEASRDDENQLASRMAAALSAKFGYDAPLVVCSHKHLKDVIAKAPAGYGSQPETYRYDVLFLIHPLLTGEVLKHISLKEGVDAVASGPGVLYFSRLASRAAQSRLNRVAALPLYKNMTLRNWNTTSRLLALMNSR